MTHDPFSPGDLPRPSSPPTPSDASSTDSEHTPRTFAELHRDAWRVAFRSPLLILVLPIVIWFPFDVLYYTYVFEPGEFSAEQLRLEDSVQRLMAFIIGIPVLAAAFLGVLAVARREKQSRLDAIDAWVDLSRRFLVTTFIGVARVFLAFLLLIVPGFYYTIRYALALPAAAIEDLSGKDALDESTRTMAGSYWRLTRYALGGTLLYLPVCSGWALLVPDDAHATIHALASTPLNLLWGVSMVGLALFYVDRRRASELYEPVGRRSVTAQTGELILGVRVPSTHGASTAVVDDRGAVHPLASAAAAGSGRRSVWIAAAISAAACVICAVPIVRAILDYQSCDELFQAGDYQSSVSCYEELEAADPTDAFVKYQLGLCYIMLDDWTGAESYMLAAVELEPDDGDYHLGYAWALIFRGDLDSGAQQLRMARSLGVSNPELIENAESMLSDLREAEYREEYEIDGEP